MTDVATLLQHSRAAHKQARALMEKKQLPQAREVFRVALDKRLAARALDPTRSDPAWDEDLKNLHSGARWVAQGRAPAMKQLSEMDAELERYFRQHLGEAVNIDRTP